jgi:hypothetical protein
MKKINIETLQTYLRKGPALVIGPGVSSFGGVEVEILEKLKDRYKAKDSAAKHDHFLFYADQLLADDSVGPSDLRAWTSKYVIDEVKPNPSLSAIVKIYTPAVVSLCIDDNYREALKEYRTQKTSSRSVATISSFGVNPSSRSIPYYTLMGDPRDQRDNRNLVCSASSYLSRKRSWSRILSSFLDRVKGDPILFLGTDAIKERVRDFLDELLRMTPNHPNKFIFLDSDSCAQDSTIVNLIEEFGEIEVVENCSPQELGNKLSERPTNFADLPLFRDLNSEVIDLRRLGDFEGKVCYVPSITNLNPDESQWHRNLDLLFRPTHLNWVPYALDLPFRRDITQQLTSEVTEHLGLLGGESLGLIYQIHGDAGVGKTTILRSVAYEMANSVNVLSLWVRKVFNDLTDMGFSDLISTLNKESQPDSKLVIFLDDPLGNRVDPSKLIRDLKMLKRRWTLLVCTRNSDGMFSNTDARRQMQGVPVVDIEVGNQFTEGEREMFLEYLVKLRVCSNSAVAKRYVEQSDVKNSKDVLGHLWYLLPETKSQLDHSLTDEYNRLGSAEASITSFIEAAKKNKEVVRLAYEYVAVCSNLSNIALPVEVLVGALGVVGESYASWREVAASQKILWGLIYEEDFEAAESYGYRTRNSIVTDVLIRNLNSGSLSNSREFQRLKELVEVCSSSAPAYRAFIESILIDNSGLVANRFSYDQCVDIYDLALETSVSNHGKIRHHKAIIERKKGGDINKVYQDLTLLIADSENSMSEDCDAPHLLNNTAAATIRKGVEMGVIDPSEGGDVALAHIGAAIRKDQFSVHTHHVHATTLLAIAEKTSDSDRSSFLKLILNTLEILDRASVVENGRPSRSNKASDGNRVSWFGSIERKLATLLPEEILNKDDMVEVLQRTGGQSGVVLLIRTNLAKAKMSGKGKDFNRVDDLVREVIGIVDDRGDEPSSSLRLARVELKIHWQINASKGPVFWEEFEEDLRSLFSVSVGYGDDFFLLFYWAVAMFNLGKITESQTVFQRLRSSRIPQPILHTQRCFYLGDKTNPVELEGVVEKGAAKRKFIYSARLGTDIEVRHAGLGGKPGEIQHYKIVFSMNGPLACSRDYTID